MDYPSNAYTVSYYYVPSYIIHKTHTGSNDSPVSFPSQQDCPPRLLCSTETSSVPPSFSEVLHSSHTRLRVSTVITLYRPVAPGRGRYVCVVTLPFP